MNNELGNLNQISVTDIKTCLKKLVPGEFDKMIISSEEPVKRANYFYVKHKSIFATREGKIVKFPLYGNIKDIFLEIEGGEKKHGEKAILSSEKILDTLKSSYGITPSIFNIKSIGKPFEFPFDANGDIVPENQRKYFVPDLTFQEQCDECNGNKYVQCPDPDCKGQHIYECTECKGSRKVQCRDCRGTGWEKCDKCSGTGEIKCKKCGGRGEEKCSTCHGDGRDEGTFLGNVATRAAGTLVDVTAKGDKYVKCKKCGGKGYIPCRECKDGFNRCSECNGKGEVRCTPCSGRGEVDCPVCNASGKLTCAKCYGDKEHYGLVDCPKCKTQGVMAQMVFVETAINNNQIEKIFLRGDKLNNIDENSVFNKHPNKSEPTSISLININENVKEMYDEYSKEYCQKIQAELGYSLKDFPIITNEEVNYQVIPCIQVTYKHMLTNEMHEVTILNFFKNAEVIFHSKAEEVKKDLGNATKAVGGLFGKLFQTKGFKMKEDKKNEITLMIYLAKADGVIEEEEKVTLSEVISSLADFTAGEKQEIFNLMNTIILPELTVKQTTFSDKDRAMEVIANLEKMASADGIIAGKEKELIEKIQSMLKYK
ncbi:MAG: TerB family tellurite resistance protein [Bacteroidota bacterium]